MATSTDFLVEIEVDLPHDMPGVERSELIEAERRRGLELIEAGLLVHIWRVPGRSANIGIWSAPDATSLHAAVTSLPLFPWMDVHVTALADHPLQPRSH